ncbi:hypothetical protein TH19_16155 [Thalassospira profundimaris]|uniref:Flagellar hook-length control protein-like C-terminal domain-containing protein n=2 Tax=Thalassospira TaxID=168934 RepID=A0A367W5T6_9PROT|nr:hypothetical protein TH19_16155 [Thalassospira profundimaris]
MASITDNWSERNSQIKYDAAKSAQSTLNESRADRAADRNVKTNDNSDHARADDRNDDRSLRDNRDDRDDHTKVDDPKSDDRRDVAENGRDTDDMQHTESDTPSENGSNPREEAASSSDDDGKPAVAQSEGTEEKTLAEQGLVDPNQPVAAVVVPGATQPTDQAKIIATATQSTQGSAINAPQNNGMQNGQQTAAADDLMSSTALSQPVAASSAKMAMNGVDGTATDDTSSDKFLARIVESMTGDGKTRTDATGATATTSNTASATNTQQTTATNPAQNAQQAMAAAAAGVPVQQNSVANGGQTTAQNTSAVGATGSTDASVQAGNGQLNSTSNLHQTTAGQTAQTARQAPGQQVQQQVAVSIKNAASEGVDKISVQLRPEHLGRVDVKLEIGHDGRIQGVIQADTRETLDMLRQDSRALQQALRDAGLNADSQSFTFEHRDQGGRGQEGQSQSRMTANQGTSPSDGDILSGAELAEHVGIGYGINPNGLVDIRI